MHQRLSKCEMILNVMYVIVLSEHIFSLHCLSGLKQLPSLNSKRRQKLSDSTPNLSPLKSEYAQHHLTCMHLIVSQLNLYNSPIYDYSEISRNNETLSELRQYQDFLYRLAPQVS